MSFRLADSEDGMIPRTIERAVTSGGAWLQGAPLVINGSNEFAEAGADPATIHCFALTPAGTDTSGFNILAKKEFPPGYAQGITVALNKRFRAFYTGSLPAADGGDYGITKGADSIWRVDFGKTGGSARVRLVDRLTNAPESQAEVIVEVLAANAGQV